MSRCPGAGTHLITLLYLFLTHSGPGVLNGITWYHVMYAVGKTDEDSRLNAKSEKYHYLLFGEYIEICT